jgi:hypothetical protein
MKSQPNPSLLPLKMQKNGFTLSLLHREGNRAIYLQQVSENCQYFEVIRIRTKPAGVFKGKSYPPREVYPSSESWGELGWTYRTYEKAIEKFNALKL